MRAGHQGRAKGEYQGLDPFAQHPLAEIEAETGQHHEQRQCFTVVHADTMPDGNDRDDHRHHQGPLLHARVGKQGHAE